MALYDEIISVYPELTVTPEKDEFAFGSIELCDDGDGVQYIGKWEYSKPIPAGLKIGN